MNCFCSLAQISRRCLLFLTRFAFHWSGYPNSCVNGLNAYRKASLKIYGMIEVTKKECSTAYRVKQNRYILISQIKMTVTMRWNILCVLSWTLFLSALHGLGKWFDSSSSALLWGAFEWDWCVFVGEWPIYVPVAGPGLPSWPHPEPLQCALYGPPQFRHGQRQQHHTQNHIQSVFTIISEV